MGPLLAALSRFFAQMPPWEPLSPPTVKRVSRPGFDSSKKVKKVTESGPFWTRFLLIIVVFGLRFEQTPVNTTRDPGLSGQSRPATTGTLNPAVAYLLLTSLVALLLACSRTRGNSAQCTLARSRTRITLPSVLLPALGPG